MKTGGQRKSPQGRPRASSGTGSAPHEVRIIGGQWRSRLLPVADTPGLRPTPDRVRETLFNWLGQDLTGWRVLDAFAGSGALGLEAASRGAASVTMLERERLLCTVLRQGVDKLGCASTVSVQQAEAVGWMRAAPPTSFDLVFLDPPFSLPLLAPAMAAAWPLVATSGFVYAEGPSAWAGEMPPGWTLWRQGRAGAVHYQLLQCSSYTDSAPGSS
ncbi:MAG: 16S rRNA (guanine(966)-N(2))-methyltransferase RsmD [Aquabacterium sp.]